MTTVSIKENTLEKTASPLISIIVPVYNVEKYIERCVDSILAQSYRNLEVILVDDGSPDRCPEICDRYGLQDKRVKVLHQSNAGLSAARNAGIDIASGDYLGFVDSDDWISKDMYEQLHAAAARSAADISICNFQCVDESDFSLRANVIMPIKDEVLSGIEVITQKLSSDQDWYWVIACNKLYRRDLFSDIRYPLGKLHEDEFIIHRLLLKCSKVAGVSKALYFYLQRTGGITKTKYSIRRLDAAEANFERADMLLSQGIEARAAYYACSIGLMVLARSYGQMSFQDLEYKQRYNELSGKFREVAGSLLKTKLPLIIKARILTNRVSPFFTWLFFERFLRALKERTPKETMDRRDNPKPVDR